MNGAVKKIQYLYFLLFRKPSELQLAIQMYDKEAKAGGDDKNFKSYTALKHYQKKLRRFLVLFFLGLIIFGGAVFVGILFLLKFLFSLLGIENNPFNFISSIF